MMSKKEKKDLLTSQIVGIDKRSDWENISVSSLEKLQILCDTPEMVSRHTGCEAVLYQTTKILNQAKSFRIMHF